ncbi:alpha/beta fold hydrolase, partial [Chloroflexota bacterium]
LHKTPFSSEEYLKVIPILSKRYWVVVMDTLGYGNSDQPPQGYRIEDYAQGIVHFLDALHIKKTSIVGNHTGTALGVEVAATCPERVDKLVLLGCSLYTPEEREVFLNNPKYAPIDINKDGSFLMKDWEYCLSNSPYLDLEDSFRMFVAHMMAGPRLHDAHYAAFRYEKGVKLPLVKSPTLLIYGREDQFCRKLEAVRDLIPRCKTRVFEKASSGIPLEKPEELAEAVFDFLSNPGV